MSRALVPACPPGAVHAQGGVLDRETRGDLPDNPAWCARGFPFGCWSTSADSAYQKPNCCNARRLLTLHGRAGKIRRMSQPDLSDLARRVPAVLCRVLAQEFGRALAPRVVVLFGSRATGRSRVSSDVDLAIALDAPLQEQQRQRLEASIAAALQVDTDLVDLLSAPSHLVSRALRDGQVLVGAGSPALGSIISRMVSEREDIAPYQRRILEERVR